ncbi:MAG: macrolide ABC transporter ATP-binding protein [candidate division Zixibacteria bacterium CG_4_9_14_3_um_filter_46_8]|nr:MAG: macrolide ABC transporter ATP-binding protein [candidate division Zixibacteria bacterium CG_4_9_14_3_um_filter_46_8]
MIKMNGLSKIYKTGKVSVEALRKIDIDIDENEFVAIVGPSGSGKSTLMNIIGCLDTPSTGDYYLDDEEVGRFGSNKLAEVRNRKIGFVFQNFNLLSYATTYENIELPLIFSGMPAKRRKTRTMELLDRVGLAERAAHKPTELSGGEMQRIAIARALANNPAILLADEPTGNLDSVSGGSIIEIFRELHADGATIVMITHDRHIADNIPRVIKLKDGGIVDSLN